MHSLLITHSFIIELTYPFWFWLLFTLIRIWYFPSIITKTYNLLTSNRFLLHLFLVLLTNLSHSFLFYHQILDRLLREKERMLLGTAFARRIIFVKNVVKKILSMLTSVSLFLFETKLIKNIVFISCLVLHLFSDFFLIFIFLCAFSHIFELNCIDPIFTLIGSHQLSKTRGFALIT